MAEIEGARMRTTITFDEVSRMASKRCKCVMCGNRRERTERFHQTVNPFNRNADGTVKSRRDIGRELDERVIAWRAQSMICRTCEDAAEVEAREQNVAAGRSAFWRPRREAAVPDRETAGLQTPPMG
jgi:hypothetical protein